VSPKERQHAAAATRLRKRLEKVIRECEQRIRDIEWWNLNRADAAPFDVGGDKVQVALAKEMLSLVNDNKPIPDSLYDRLIAQSEALCKL
jgi:hypothetical protein